MSSLFFLPHLIALSITIWVAYYAWKQSTNWGMKLFAWYVSGYILWITAFIFEANTPNLQIKILWDTFQWGVCILAVPALPTFALLYTQKELSKYRRVYKLLLALAAILLVLTFSDNVHGLLHVNPQIVHENGLPQLVTQPSLLHYTLLAYIYGMLIWGIYILAEEQLRPKKPQRRQTLLLILGFVIPAFGAFFDLANITPPFGQISIPLTIALGHALNAWNLKQYNVFLINPTSRNEAFEAMMDPVVILDNNNVVIDINRSMLDLLGREANDIIGQQAKDAFDDFPIPIKLYSSVSYARAEAEFDISGQTVHYEMSVWPILDFNHNVTSRLYISHDITALKELEKELRYLNDKLEARVLERTKELANSYDYTLEGWAKALELRDKETEGHSRRVTETTLRIARALDIPNEELEHIRRGAILHDIGKMAIPDDVLLKPGKLTLEERAVMEQHPTIAYHLLERIPFLARATDIPHCHHEKWDGSGYPRGLKEYQIPIAARIFAIADVWDALRSDRPYGRVWDEEEALDYIVDQAGKHFDPRIAEVFIDLFRKGKIE